jgi:hypothetical protein
MEAPSKEQISRFLRCFDILSRFDAEQRLKEWPDKPDKDAVAVKVWLEGLGRGDG